MSQKTKVAKWRCFKCKVKMESADIKITYLDVTHTVKGLRCPKCGAKYIPEEDAVRVAKLEEMIEEKERIPP